MRGRLERLGGEGEPAPISMAPQWGMSGARQRPKAGRRGAVACPRCVARPVQGLAFGRTGAADRALDLWKSCTTLVTSIRRCVF